jgi:hypothetical protein
MWTIKETTQPREKLELMAELKSRLLFLKDEIPEIMDMKVNFNAISAPENNYDIILECEFSSWSHLEAYQKHPAHVAVAEYVKNIGQNRAAIDYEY